MAEDLNPSLIYHSDIAVSNFKVEVEAQATPLSDVEWSDVEIINDHLFIKDIGASNLLSKDIHQICSLLKVKGVKNMSKDVMLSKLKDSFSNRKKNALISMEVNSFVQRTMKEPQCTFSLLNILFTDELYTLFVSRGYIHQYGATSLFLCIKMFSIQKYRKSQTLGTVG